MVIKENDGLAGNEWPRREQCILWTGFVCRLTIWRSLSVSFCKTSGANLVKLTVVGAGLRGFGRTGIAARSAGYGGVGRV